MKSRGEKAVSEVVGMIMILSIMMFIIGAIMITGVPMIESSKNRAKMDTAANSFVSLQNDIEEVVRGPVWIQDPNSANTSGLGPSREAAFELMGGTLSIQPGANVSCTPNCTANNINITIPASNITYTAGQESIIYENGAVIRKYQSGVPLMIKEPLINIYDNGSDGTMVSIHAIVINRTSSSVGGDGSTNVEIRLINYGRIIQAGSANTNQTNITIYSAYPQAWSTFFDVKLRGAGLNSTRYNISGTSPLIVKILGKGKNTTILSVYESRLDVKVG